MSVYALRNPFVSPAAPAWEADARGRRDRRSEAPRDREIFEGSARRVSEEVVPARAATLATTRSFVEASRLRNPEALAREAAALYARTADVTSPQAFGYVPGSLLRAEA